MQAHTVNNKKFKQKPDGCQLTKPLKRPHPEPMIEKIRRDNIKRNELFLRSLEIEP